MDFEQPQCTPPNDIELIISLGVGGRTASWTEPRVTDNCGVVTLQSRSHAPGDFFSTGNTRVTYRFVDAAQNSVSCGFNVNIVEGNIFLIMLCYAMVKYYLKYHLITS